ncbi:MAG TPA: nucleoside-diphosphate sugar epimerase/dehydratase [Vicinamibacterales bacterium]|nr:nucleoside-diphosphate sugar epimerase/dehydratase [Vicinamibacterales bacterium]
MSPLLKYRRVLVVALHLVIIVVASYTAFLLRFDGTIPPNYLQVFWQALPWLVAIRLITFAPFKLFEGLWRYAGIWDLRNIIVGVAASSGLFYQFALWRLPEPAYPRSILVIDSVLLIVGMGGARLGRRLFHELSRAERRRRVLVFGAGDAGEKIVRDLRGTAAEELEPIGFIDDDAAKSGMVIHGVPVLGTRRSLAAIIDKYQPSEFVVAIPSAGPGLVAEVVRALEPYRIAIKTLPTVGDLRQGRRLVSQIRPLKIEDLLERPPIGLDARPIECLVRGKRVLVTGAGGSIGSELCYQIAALRPASLTLFERYENGLFAVTNGLAARADCVVNPVVGDVTDRRRVDELMSLYAPEIVFHAAAHKHVPLMEGNPCEAVKNNVFGTHTVMDAAARYGVDRFVLISTDKAVNPTSVMGATKRVAELLVQSKPQRGRTSYVAVRFGNVLASNGSVLPTFMEQIKAGGPVTVTHPEMRRYFMLIPEAVHLVLHAAALAEAGAVYLLEMGAQVKLLDMARNLIRLSGFVPEEEIPIVFTGVRPGEKLYEELVGADEQIEPSAVDKIRRVRPTTDADVSHISGQIAILERLAFDGGTTETLRQLQRLVPTFTPDLDAERVALVS